jgi:hypothetical protein
MPAIGDMQYGFDAAGIQTYLDQIHDDYLLKAEAAARDTKGVEGVCKNEWEGIARDNFITNLHSDAEHVASQFETLYNILISEVSAVGAAMANKDETMIG